MAELYTDTGLVVGNVTISEKGRTTLMRRLGIQRNIMRAAKRKNRVRRLTRWKTEKTYHGTIKGIVRRCNKIIKTPSVYCSADTGLQEMSVTEAAKRLMLAEPSPSVPVLFVMDKSDAEEWRRAGANASTGGNGWQK